MSTDLNKQIADDTRKSASLHEVDLRWLYLRARSEARLHRSMSRNLSERARQEALIDPIEAAKTLNQAAHHSFAAEVPERTLAGL